MQCPECRAEFTPRRSDQAFCSARCNQAANTRETARARRIYRALYWWRYDRQGGFGKNMLFVCREISAWIREDRAAQRPPPPKHDHDNDRGHQRPARPVKLKPMTMKGPARPQVY